MNLIKFLAISAACYGVTLSVVAAKPKSKPTSSTGSFTTVSAQTTARNVSTLTTEVLSKSTTPAATETSATTTLAPTKDIWTVSYPNTSRICILLSAHISVTYNDHGELKNLIVPSPSNGSQAHGSCGPKEQFITICSGDHSANLSVTFNFKMDNNSMYHMNSFSLEAEINNTLISVTQVVSKYWPEGMDNSKSYRCNTTEILYSNDNATASLLTKLTMCDVLLEAFQNTTQAQFSNAVVECKDDRAVSNLVPIIVGAALGGLILIVLIAYLIGRKRSRRGYEQV